MQDPYIASVIRGLTIAGGCLAFASAAAVVLFAVLAVTQNPILVSVVPAVAIFVVTAGFLVLLQKDANARRRVDGRSH